MFLQQGIWSISNWQSPLIPYLNIVIPYTHLDWCAGIIFMRYGIVQYFTQCLLRNLQRLTTFHAFIVYGRCQVFGFQHLHYTVGHLDYVSFNHILNDEVSHITSETSDLEFHTGKVPTRILGKQQKGGIFQFAILCY